MFSNQVEGNFKSQLVIELMPPNPRKVVTLGVEEQVLEVLKRCVVCGRIAAPETPVDLDDRIFDRADGVHLQRVPKEASHEHAVDEQHLDFLDTVGKKSDDGLVRDFFVALDQNSTGVHIDDVVGRDLASDGLFVDGNYSHFDFTLNSIHHADFLGEHAGLPHLAENVLQELLVLATEDIALTVNDVHRGFLREQ